METPPLEGDHSFAPANHKLVGVYLHRRISGEPLLSAAAASFHDIDIYTADPATLTAGLLPLTARKGDGSSWLFFNPVKTKSSTESRRCRRVGGGLGTWHSEHAPEAVIDDEGNRVGHRQLFSFKDKSGRRSGWSMWEFAAYQEGGETLLVLCKIHQGHASSRRADGSAVRTARKRKVANDDVDKMAPAPVKRRLFAPALPPPTPTPPAASEDSIDATAEAICSDMTKTQALVDELDVVVDAVPTFRDKAEASKDTLRPVMGFWEEESSVLQQGEINVTLTPVHSFSPRPDASKISTTMECPTTAGLLIPEPEAIPSSRTETEASKDGPRPVMVFFNEDEACPSQLDNMSATSTSLGSFSPKPIAPRENIISPTVGSPATFLAPETQALQGERATINCGFLMDDPPPLEYCYNGSFIDSSDRDISGVPLCAPGSEISNTTEGVVLGPLASLAGYDTTESCSCNNAFIGALPTYSEGISRFAGVQYGCGYCEPSAPLLPLAAPSWWCFGPSF